MSAIKKASTALLEELESAAVNYSVANISAVRFITDNFSKPLKEIELKRLAKLNVVLVIGSDTDRYVARLGNLLISDFELMVVSSASVFKANLQPDLMLEANEKVILYLSNKVSKVELSPLVTGENWEAEALNVLSNFF